MKPLVPFFQLFHYSRTMSNTKRSCVSLHLSSKTRRLFFAGNERCNRTRTMTTLSQLRYLYKSSKMHCSLFPGHDRARAAQTSTASFNCTRHISQSIWFCFGQLEHSRRRRAFDEAILFSHALSCARKTRNHYVPRLIYGHITSSNVSRVHKFRLGRQVGPRYFRHAGRMERDAVLFLGAVWSRNRHRCILHPLFGIPFLIFRRENLKDALLERVKTAQKRPKGVHTRCVCTCLLTLFFSL